MKALYTDDTLQGLVFESSCRPHNSFHAQCVNQTSLKQAAVMLLLKSNIQLAKH